MTRLKSGCVDFNFQIQMINLVCSKPRVSLKQNFSLILFDLLLYAHGKAAEVMYGQSVILDTLFLMDQGISLPERVYQCLAYILLPLIN